MKARVAPIEISSEIAASAWFSGCVGLSFWVVAPLPPSGSILLALCGATIGGFGALGLLRKWRDPGLAMPDFDLAPLDVTVPDELLLIDELVRPAVRPLQEIALTLEQRLGTQQDSGILKNDELLLEDVLTPIDTGSRVIRLFDPAAMPTAGELQSRIDRHLQNRDGRNYPDAAQALNDALADLRRSLR